jgi:hypothetical protein
VLSGLHADGALDPSFHVASADLGGDTIGSSDQIASIGAAIDPEGRLVLTIGYEAHPSWARCSFVVASRAHAGEAAGDHQQGSSGYAAAVGRKRPERTERRARERAARELVRDREKLAKLSPGGAPERPIDVESSAVIEGRVRSTPCAQCEGAYRVLDHRAEGSGLRAVAARCQRCGVPRTLWFRLVSREPS